MDDLITASEVARERRCHYRTVMRAVHSGALVPERWVGRSPLFRRAVADRWIPRDPGRPARPVEPAKSARAGINKSADLPRRNALGQ